MPFDGTMTYALCREIDRALVGGRVDKIYQPENEEIVLCVRKDGKTRRLLLSASADSPHLALTEQKPETPLTPPSFCMLLRKHFEDARFLGITQIGFDRIVALDFEKLNEIGDLTRRRIVLEMMGKYSNMMIVREDGRILDAVRHVNPLMSSVRVVQPGQMYELPSHNHKANPLEEHSAEGLREKIAACAGPVVKALYTAYNGFCPLSAREILALAALDDRLTVDALTDEDYTKLYEGFALFMKKLCEEEPRFSLYSDEEKLLDYSAFPYVSMQGLKTRSFETGSALLDEFFAGRVRKTKLEQKAGDIAHLINTNLERAQRKAALQQDQLADAADREEDKHLGDLITANLYLLRDGMTRVTLTDYYKDPPEQEEICLDPRLTPAENAQHYYKRYNKKKRTEEAVTDQLNATRGEIDYLESLKKSLQLAECEADVESVRLELAEAGYLKAPGKKKKNLAASKPLSFRTSEGLEVLVGKNNLQNDFLTFKVAAPADTWFHVKNAPGSHTVLRTAGLVKGEDYTDKSIEEAATLCASYSSLSSAGGGRICVEYTLRKYIKKPAGSRPGFVTYTHQSALVVDSSK